MIRALVLCAALAPVSGHACAVAEPYAVTDVAHWPVVVIAEVAAYSRDDRLEGHVTLDVSEVLKGEVPARIEALWPSMLAEIAPDSWDRPSRVIAAVVPADGGFTLAVEMCGSAMLAEATAANIAAVKDALP